MAQYQTNFTGEDSDFETTGKPSTKGAAAEKKSNIDAGLTPEDQKTVEGIDAGLEGDTPEADDKAEEKKPAAKKAPAKKTAAKKADEKSD